ncbi:MAG: hypothetical protein H6707_09165 [Deltaproteobacteria bacterium]|nr:hypothetical protein [Deltaproteobacteria bacterium]
MVQLIRLPLIAALLLFTGSGCDERQPAAGSEDASIDDAAKLKSDAITPPLDTGSKDSSADATINEQTFACGASATCTTPEYCRAESGGAAIKMPAGSTACDADCTRLPNVGTADEVYCICTRYSCVEPPANCRACDCIPLPAIGCQCTKDSGGKVWVDCPGA